MEKGLCQHQRKRIRQQEPAAWLLSANTDSMHSDASSEETERWCTTWVATSYVGPAVKQGSSRSEKWSSRCSRRRSSENHGLTWTSGDILDCRTSALISPCSTQNPSTTPLSCEEGERRRWPQHQQSGRERERVRTSERRSGSH